MTMGVRVMRNLLKGLRFDRAKWLPFLFGISFAITSLVFVSVVFESMIHSSLATADKIQIAIMFFIAGTMVVGMWVHHANEKMQISSSNLAHAIELVRRAHNVLRTEYGELTNDRVSWVTCARLITRALAIRDQLTSNSHYAVFEAEHDYQRHLFYELFSFNGRELGGGFFCGGSPDQEIGQAAVESCDGRSWIPPAIISVIFRFYIYPEGYDDPLDGASKLTPRELDRLWLYEYRGVCDYLNFRTAFRTVGREIRSNVHFDKTAARTAEEINQVVRGRSGSFDHS